jgi:HSP20 family protein
MKQKEKLVNELRSSSRFADARVFEQEGQLAIDIYQTENKLIIQSAIAGVKQEDLNIVIERDLISIKGKREEPIVQKDESEKKDYFVQECYWGPFSRKIVLPVEINPDNVEASMKDGVLVIQLIKVLREKKRKIEVK